MYIATKNNPFYPDVEYFETIEEAQKQQKEWLRELSNLDGKYKCSISISNVIDTKTIISAY